MKILNLYAGIGGNRKLWTEHHKDLEITAVENNEEIAKIYCDFFPDDEMIITDAHEYLLHNYQDYDFIWSSPPCPTHSRFNHLHNVQGGNVKMPDMGLWQQIIFLKSWFKGKYCVENVITYYEPLLPAQEIANHYFWTNFYITPMKANRRGIRGEFNKERIEQMSEYFDIKKIPTKNRFRRQVINNCVEPETGLHILNCGLSKIDKTKSTQLSLLD